MKNNFAKLSRIFNNQRPSAGFTLIELLVAALLTTVVTSLAGTGIVAITENNKKAQAETERRVEINRALDFISDEVRQAKFVAKDASATLAIVAPSFYRSGKTPVLTLQIPGVAERVIYYIAPKPAGSPWLGPNIIYRWGPKLKIDGTYDNPTTPGEWDDNVETADPIADLVVNTALSADPCPSIGSGWTLTQPIGSAQGFYACVDPDGRIAKPYLLGKLRDAYGNSRTSSFDVTTKTFARSFELAAAQGAAALATAEAAAAALAAAEDAAEDAATNAATAVSNLGGLQTAANNAATALTNAISALTAAQNTANTTPTAASYTALAAAEQAVATAITNARNTATAARDLQIEVDRTADLNATAQQAVVTAADNARTTAANAGQSSTEQAATTYATTAQTTANNAVSSYTAAAQTAAIAATAAQAAVDQNATTLTTATVAAATTHTDAATSAELRAATRATTDSVFTTNNGVITFTQQATGTFKIIGGDADQLTPYTTTTIYKTALNGNTDSGTSVPRPANNQSPIITQAIAPAGTKLTVRGYLPPLVSGYGGFNADSNETNRNTQVWALRNGDTLPSFTPYPGQVPPRNYLQAEGYLDANGKVKLADNQVIYLFEVTTTDKTRNDYDMQDIIVLATIEPTTVPIAPTITATVSGTPVTLSWSAVTHAAAYELYRCVAAKTASCTPTTLVSQVSSGITQNVSSITTNQKICFAVKAKNSLGTSDLSNKLCSNRQGEKENP